MSSGAHLHSRTRAPLAAALAVALAAASARAQDERVFVEGKSSQGLHAVGAAWEAGKGFVEGSGEANGLYARPQLGAGDFEIVARLAVFDLVDSLAAFEIAGSRLEFARGAPESRFAAHGRVFAPPSATVGAGALPLTEEILRDGRTFELRVQRAGSELSALVDGREVLRVGVGEAALGEFGLRPGRGRMRVFALRARATWVDLAGDEERQLERLQPAIDRAIDRGMEYLIKAQGRDGSWSFEHGTYPTGQTALATYALLKSGAPTTHPAVARALEYLRARPAGQTYAAACQLLAFDATGDVADREQMQAALDDLLAWEQGGVWPYPWGDPDLSNTQYAALGLRAAAHAGLEVPERVWARLAEAALVHQERPYHVAAKDDSGARKGARVEIAGFLYRQNEGAATGSMTTAGIVILALAREALGERAPPLLAKKMQIAIDLGVAWLEDRFTVAQNPEKPDWAYYYLYGLERVGALLGLARIGAHPWYLEGAAHLVRVQGDDGAWSGNGPEPDTCFALLFLTRATAATSTGESKKKRDGLYAAEGEEHDVWIRAAGHAPMVVWLSGFAQKARERFGAAGPRVASVEYLVDGVVVATVAGDPGAAWNGERFPARYAFPEPGTYRVRARAHVLAGQGGEPLADGAVVLESGELEAQVKDPVASWLLDYAADERDNVLDGAEVEATASSHSGGDAPERVADGDQGTRWLCAADDPRPTLVLELKRPVTATAIRLSPAMRNELERGHLDRVVTVEVLVNRTKKPLVLTLDEDELKKSTLRLPQASNVRRVEIAIVARERGSVHAGLAGFAEVELVEER